MKHWGPICVYEPDGPHARMAETPLGGWISLEDYAALYKALNEFKPVEGTEDWVAVRLSALALVLDNPPDQL